MRRCFAFAVVALLATLALSRHAAAKGETEFLTFHVSGGDLPHPVTVPVVDTTATMTGFGSWYGDTRLPEPAPSATRYQVDRVSVRHPGDPPFETWTYVPGTTPTVLLSGDSGPPGWAALAAPITSLLDRYIALAKAGRIGETPTFAEALRASVATWGTSVSVGGTQLAGADRERVLSLLEQIEPVYYGVQARMLGSRDLHTTELRIVLGPHELSFAYVPPGPVAPYGLLFPSNAAGSWDYIQILDPPGYAQLAYTVPSAFENLMTARGIDGGLAQEIISPRTVPLADVTRATAIDRLEVWTGGGPHSFIPFSACPRLCGETPDNVCVWQPYGATAPLGVEPTKVAVWLKGLEPFPEAVTPAVYDYYPPSQGISTRGIFIERQAGALYSGGPGFGLDPPCYTSHEVDALLTSVHTIAGNPVAMHGVGGSSSWVTKAILAAGLSIGMLIALAALRSLRPVAPR